VNNLLLTAISSGNVQQQLGHAMFCRTLWQ